MDKSTYAYVIGIEFALSLALHLVAIYKTWGVLGKFMWKKYSTEICPKVSVFMIALLASWLLTSLSYVPKEVYILSVWRPRENLRNGDWIFWSYMPSLCQYSTVPVFVFFLTLDRIFTIHFNIRYQNNTEIRRIFLLTMLLLAIALWTTNFIAFTNQLPIPRKTDCWTFTCLVGDGGMNFYLASRVAIAIPNCVGALVFLHLLFKMNRRQNQQQNVPNSIQSRQRARANRYNNLITFWAVCSEFLLNFVPYFLPLIIQKLTGFNIVANVGVFASMLSAVEGLIFVCIYCRVLRRLEKDNSSLVAYQTGMRKQQKTEEKAPKTQLPKGTGDAQPVSRSMPAIA